MSEMWNRVAPGWERNADYVDAHLAVATDALLDAAGIAEGDRALAGPFSLDDPVRLTSVFEEGGLEAVRVDPLFTPMHAESLRPPATRPAGSCWTGSVLVASGRRPG